MIALDGTTFENRDQFQSMHLSFDVLRHVGAGAFWLAKGCFPYPECG
jgi:hypothetical protein